MLSLRGLIGLTAVLRTVALPPSLDELDQAAYLFDGLELEEVATASGDFNPKWLESPLWNEAGKYLLFTDVKWTDSNGITSGMIWRWDATNGVTPFLKQAGLVGPGTSHVEQYGLHTFAELGSNGMVWGWKGESDLIFAQHAQGRIARINTNDIVNASIADDKVQVLAEEIDGEHLNSPNDLKLFGDTLLFTDPVFGLQRFNETNAGGWISDPYEIRTTQIIGCFAIKGDGGQAKRILSFPEANSKGLPNGIAVTADGDVIVGITHPVDGMGGDPNNKADARVEIYRARGKNIMDLEDNPTKISFDQFQITCTNTTKGYCGFRLTDGVTSYPEEGVIFASCPGGVCVIDRAEKMLGFLRVDDLVSNFDVGGGYLWMSANQRILRIKLSSNKTSPGGDGSGDGSGGSDVKTSGAFSTSMFLAQAAVVLVTLLC